MQDKTIIITGASRGLGKAIFESLLPTGANLVLVSRNTIKNPLLFASHSNRVLSLTGDIRSEEDINKIIRQALSKFGQIDVLINNAGMFVEKTIEKATVDDFNSVMDTNIRGMFLFSRAVVPFMKKRKTGLIINVGSKITHKTNLAPGRTIYATSKYAVEGFSLALQRELQPFKIRVTCLLPSTLRTFASFSSHKYLKLNEVARIITMIIEMKEINFDSIMFQSVNQYL